METMYDDDGKLVYLYRVIDGLCTRSHAFSAALAVGLPDIIIRRANEVSIDE
jgi:DNA mismatch repair ATPase MutS